jgi:hypothetical protein
MAAKARESENARALSVTRGAACNAGRVEAEFKIGIQK